MVPSPEMFVSLAMNSSISGVSENTAMSPNSRSPSELRSTFLMLSMLLRSVGSVKGPSQPLKLALPSLMSLITTTGSSPENIGKQSSIDAWNVFQPGGDWSLLRNNVREKDTHAGPKCAGYTHCS